MRGSMRRPAAMFVVALAISNCAPTAEERPEESAQTVADTDRQSADDGDGDKKVESEADRLARRVVEKTGDPYELQKLAFSFVVVDGGEERVRRRYVWRPDQGELEATKGGETVELTDVDEHELSRMTAEPERHEETWKEIAPAASADEAADAWAWFINDSYWLFAPAKLFDPGVERTLDPDDSNRLVLRFGQVGLTPGDRYSLQIDPEHNRVISWDFMLESGRSGSFEWTNYREFGPLELSTRRISRDSDVEIRFEDIEVDR